MAGGRCVTLIGLRGTGKSVVGRRLAQRLGWAWIDTDREVVRRAGLTIAQLFATRGEAGFREIESRLLSELPREEHRVVSLGGGAVLRPENRTLVRSWGPVVWLQADIDTLAQRIASDPGSPDARPPLTQLSLRDEILQKSSERRSVYDQCATCAIDTTQLDVERIVDQILELLPKRWKMQTGEQAAAETDPAARSRSGETDE
jgi:shikimate kinase